MSAEPASNMPISRLTSLADRLKQAATKPAVVSVPTSSIERNPEQPRKHFDQASILELADSIRTHGIVQHLIVRPLGPGRYQLVAGERRWRAAKLADLAEIPVVVRELSDAAALAIALVENLDREDMVPSDEVTAVARLAAETSVQEAGKTLGKPAAWVSKRKRIAEAQPFVVEFVRTGQTGDIEALYELAKLADEDEAAARSLIENYAPGSHLREQIKSTARAHKDLPGDLEPGRGAENEPDDVDESADEEGFSHAKPGAAGARDPGRQPPRGEREPTGSAPNKKPADRTLVVTGAVMRKGAIVLLTKNGDEIPCAFKGEGRDQLLRLLKKR
jgi:ParB/RepB/Spo0J family partition protein